MIDTAAAVLAALGAGLIVLSDGRRGLALGIAIAGVGMALLALSSAGLVAAAGLAVGGLVAAGRRYRAGVPGWGILPPGSTPRIVLCIMAAIIALWVAAAVASGSGAELRFAVMLAVALTGARLFSGSEPSVLLSATAALALAVGLAAALASPSGGPWPFLAAGLVAASIGWLPMRSARAG